MLINGVNDPLMPYNGGDITGPLGVVKLGKVISATETINFWAKSDTCILSPNSGYSFMNCINHLFKICVTVFILMSGYKSLKVNLKENPGFIIPDSLGNYRSWYEFFQGSMGGEQTTIILPESILQREYAGEWIDDVPEYPASENKSAVVHDDLMIVYSDFDGFPSKAIYFDNEGHTINYTITYSEKSIVFISDKIPDLALFRLTYTMLNMKKINLLPGFVIMATLSFGQTKIDNKMELGISGRSHLIRI